MKRLLALFLAVAMSATLIVGCGTSTDNKQTTAQVETKKSEHSKMTKDLQKLLDKDPKLKKLMEKSLAKAKKVNPDKSTNPAQSLDELYEFTDWAATCEPWNVIPGKKSDKLYEHIDQSVDYFWFLVDQPLKELEGKGYYYPTLQYHEPIKSWCKEYADEWGKFLSTKDSWNDEYYELAKSDKRFGMDKGWYADKNIWTSYNDFFSRKLVSPRVRPISDTEVVAPADSTPQGEWDIDKNGKIEDEDKDGTIVKGAKFDQISDLIGPNSKYIKRAEDYINMIKLYWDTNVYNDNLKLLINNFKAATDESKRLFGSLRDELKGKKPLDIIEYFLADETHEKIAHHILHIDGIIFKGVNVKTIIPKDFTNKRINKFTDKVKYVADMGVSYNKLSKAKKKKVKHKLASYIGKPIHRFRNQINTAIIQVEKKVLNLYKTISNTIKKKISGFKSLEKEANLDFQEE